MELQKKHLPKGWQAWNNLQTNGLLLNKEWCRFLRENRFDVGLSIDGSEAAHDMNRRDLGGRPTYEKVRGAVRLLQDAGIQPDLLCTVNAATAADPEGTYGALEELGCVWVQFIPIVVRLPEGGFSPESVTPEGYGEFLCRVFDLWYQDWERGQYHSVRLFDDYVHLLLGDGARPAFAGWPRSAAGPRWWRRTAASTPATTLWTRSTGWAHWALTNFVICWTAPPWRASAGQSVKICPRCPWYKFCGGGCPKDRFGGGPYYLCGGLKKLFAHSVPVLERVMELSRRGLGPEAIMRRIAKGNIIE